MTTVNEKMTTTVTHFAQPDFPIEHAGAARVTHALGWAGRAFSKLGSAAGMVSVLLIAALSALIVVAEQIVSAWTDGHLLAAWIALWLIVFGLLAAFSEAIRAWPLQWQDRMQARQQAAAQRAQDRHTWAAALADPRLMADLDCAFLRAEQAAASTGHAMPQGAFIGVRKRATRPTSESTGIDTASKSASSHATHVTPTGQTKPNRGFRAAPFPGMPRHLQYLSD